MPKVTLPSEIVASKLIVLTSLIEFPFKHADLEWRHIVHPINSNVFH